MNSYVIGFTAFTFLSYLTLLIFCGFCFVSCLNDFHISSSCRNGDEKVGSDSGTKMSCQSNGKNGDVNQSFDVNDKSHATCTMPLYVTGWMYVNHNGQMCGPYIQEQLYEGLATGFLPEELPVYPILNGALTNSVPLKYFKLFPEHVSTGFTYFAAATSGLKVPRDCPMVSHCNTKTSGNYYGFGSMHEASSSGEACTTIAQSVPLVDIYLKCACAHIHTLTLT